ncbi:hypothetical protein, partial [Xanthomonas sp. WHRI 7945]|nr:hypothetical protein [Xanthomonas campestris pv. campestris]
EPVQLGVTLLAQQRADLRLRQRGAALRRRRRLRRSAAGQRPLPARRNATPLWAIATACLSSLARWQG